MILTDPDRQNITAAVAAAEATTDGEIVTIVARQSDAYHDVALHWAFVAMLFAAGALAWFPAPSFWLHEQLVGGWAETPAGWHLTVAIVLMAFVFLVTRIILARDALRMALTPPATRARRVHHRAMMLFRASAERRTRAATAVLVYVSLGEHRAEIVADAAIHGRVDPGVWGEAMATLVGGMREDRVGDGMARAVQQIGAVLSTHFPRSHDDINELPDAVIEL